MARLTRLSLVLGALIVIGGGLPILHYWWAIGRVPAMMPAEARALLRESGAEEPS